MIINIAQILFLLLFIIHLVLLIITIYNYYTAPQISQQPYSVDNNPKISILIPARNEEENIENCLNSIYLSEYNNYEVKVLDDLSTDSTTDKVKPFQTKYKNFELIKGKELPKGWIGKNWACNQLAEHALGDYLLFIDADVIISPKAIQNVMFEFRKNKAALLSVFPSQIMKSWGEWMIVPLMEWLLLTFLPLKKIFTSSNVSFAAANGQFILFDKESYFKFGGHSKIKSKIVEDMEFVRGFKKMKLKTFIILGNNFVKCRMYRNYNESLNGFSKNFYPGFNIGSFKFILLITGFMFSFLMPLLFIYFNHLFLYIVFMILLERIATSSLSRQSIYKNIILFIPQMVTIVIAGIISLTDNLNGKVLWKGRNIE